MRGRLSHPWVPHVRALFSQFALEPSAVFKKHAAVSYREAGPALGARFRVVEWYTRIALPSATVSFNSCFFSHGCSKQGAPAGSIQQAAGSRQHHRGSCWGAGHSAKLAPSVGCNCTLARARPVAASEHQQAAGSITGGRLGGGSQREAGPNTTCQLLKLRLSACGHARRAARRSQRAAPAATRWQRSAGGNARRSELRRPAAAAPAAAAAAPGCALLR